MPIVEITGAVQKYAWGMIGDSSAVARLHESAEANLGRSFKIDPSSPYAELWFGTHSSGPATLADGSKTTLADWIKQNPSALGSKVQGAWQELPFLFKVLSVKTALSIQAHPDLELAKKLHKSNPDAYKDANHKPEMTIAITPFEALCQFRTYGEIVDFLETIPELRAVIGQDISSTFVASLTKSDSHARNLKALFSALMTAKTEEVKKQLSAMVARLHESKPQVFEHELALRLHEQYPGDVGVFCAFLLNYVKLEPGQGIFLGPNEPHAYISGDCFECMATSDNVVRAGLTPKFKDVSTLCEMLTYRDGKPEILKGDPVVDGGADRAHGSTAVYRPPVNEFQIERIQAANSYELSTLMGPSILVVHKGVGKLQAGNTIISVVAGSTVFISAESKVSVTAEKPLEAFRASVNAQFWSSAS